MEAFYVAVAVILVAAFRLWRQSRGVDPAEAWVDRLEADFEARQASLVPSVETFSGTVDSITSDGTVRILDDCVVHGSVTASVVEVLGRVEGSIRATERVHLEASAVVDGASIAAPKVSIAEGAVFRGSVTLH